MVTNNQFKAVINALAVLIYRSPHAQQYYVDEAMDELQAILATIPDDVAVPKTGFDPSERIPKHTYPGNPDIDEYMSGSSMINEHGDDGYATPKGDPDIETDLKY